MEHASIDIESLSTAVDTVVLSIGAQMFNEHGLVGEGFHVVLDQEEQLPMRSVSASTLEWWMGQSQEARDAIWKAPKVSVKLALEMLRVHISRADRIWCRGLNFDLPILDHLHAQNGMKTPWAYYYGRDSRTLLELVPPGPKTNGHVAHHALSDAREEAAQLVRAWTILKHRAEAADRLDRASLAMAENPNLCAAVTTAARAPGNYVNDGHLADAKGLRADGSVRTFSKSPTLAAPY